VPEEIKRKRNNELLDAQQEVSAAENRKMVGKTVQVMVEGQSKLVSRPQLKQGGNAIVELGWKKQSAPAVVEAEEVQLVGRTRGDQVVVFEGPGSLKGELLDVEIIDSRSLTLFGRRV
jgi:tRNA-2-methylthio-N6-dimethylallyladenosine synthase